MADSAAAPATFAQSSAVVGAEIAGETILMNMDTAVYLEIDPVGARIWALLEQPRTFKALVEALMAEFDVDETVCAANTDAFLSYLAAQGFVAERQAHKGSRQ
ncbi:MAG TPA: PqqD family protein [Rhizomicrobium sp.]|jgi:hypothetical protein|nr:PqqD family protein [Rhizomicrobium sp.]